MNTEQASASLTEAQLEQIIQRYRLEMARYDGAARFALGLASKFGEKFRDLASQWRGPSTTLKRAILEATR